MSPIRLDVQPLQVNQGAFRCPPVPNHPPAELLDRLQVEIERLGADAPLNGIVGFAPILPQTRKVRLQLAGGNVTPQLEATGIECLAGAACDKLGMAFGVPLGR
ncbi:MAG: hypothetical protein ABSB74_13155 [Tepidisphaeraceae bacterium]